MSRCFHTCHWLVTIYYLFYFYSISLLFFRLTVSLIILHCFLELPSTKRVFSSSFWPRNNLFFISFGFSCASFAQFYKVSIAFELPPSAAQCHALFSSTYMDGNNFLLSHFNSVVLLFRRPSVPLVSLNGLFFLPIAWQFLLAHFWLTTAYLVLVSLP